MNKINNLNYPKDSFVFESSKPDALPIEQTPLMAYYAQLKMVKNNA